MGIDVPWMRFRCCLSIFSIRFHVLVWQLTLWHCSQLLWLRVPKSFPGVVRRMIFLIIYCTILLIAAFVWL